MTSLKAVAQLEHNVPGCIISIRIPSADISKFHTEKTIVDINCKQFFNKLCKPAVQPIQPATITSSSSNINAVDPESIVFTKPARITNRYDNIIDQLERKYYGESMVQMNKEAENDSEDSEGSMVGVDEQNDDMKEVEHAAKKSRTKSNKRKIFSEDYDMEDPFIDDEELIMEVETSLKTHRTKTRHDGFFVSSGKLEVFSPKKSQKTSSQVTAKAAAPVQKKESATVLQADPAVTLEEPPKDGEGSEKKKRKRRTKKEMEEAVLSKSAPTASPPPATAAATGNAPSAPDTTEATKLTQPSSDTIGGKDGVGSPEGAATFVTKARPEKVLPAWMPDDESLMAMVYFKTIFENTGIKLFKSSHIPKSLEDALHAVDLVVLKSTTVENLHKTSGYYEGLHAILGGEVAIGKLRSLLARLRLRDRANTVLRGIDEQVDALVRDLKSATVPCPEKLQPAFKAAKKQAKAAEGGEAAKKEAAETKESVEPQRDEEEHEGGDEAAAALNISVDGGDNGPGSPSAVAGGTRYEWVCNWSRPMKVALCAIEHSLKLWVLQENQYREKLTVHDKKYLHDTECVPLVEKDVIATYFERICNIAMPPSCLQGTTSYMRRISTLLNKVPKEKVPKPPAAAAVPSVGSAIATQVLPEEDPAKE